MKQFLDTYVMASTTERQAIMEGPCNSNPRTRAGGRNGDSMTVDQYEPSKRTPATTSGSSTGMSPYLDMSGSSSDQTTPDYIPDPAYLGFLQTDPSQNGYASNIKPVSTPHAWSFGHEASVADAADSMSWRTGSLHG